MKLEKFKYIGAGGDFPVVHVTLITLDKGDNYKHRNKHFQGPTQLALYCDGMTTDVWCSYDPKAKHQFEIVEKIMHGSDWTLVHHNYPPIGSN